MKLIRQLTALGAAGALLLTASPAFADGTAAQPTLPENGALSATVEYGAAEEIVKDLEAQTKERVCRKNKKGKQVCRAKKLSDGVISEYESELEFAFEDLEYVIDERDTDRQDAIDTWTEDRSDYRGESIEARYDSVSSYNDAWYGGGYYICYGREDLNNCGGAADGTSLPINGTGQGRADEIEAFIAQSYATRQIDRNVLRKACDNHKDYGDKAIDKAQAKVKKAKKAKEKEKLRKQVEKLQNEQAKCHTRADNRDVNALSDEEFDEVMDEIVTELDDQAIEQKDAMDEANSRWYDRATENLDREINSASAAAERIAGRQARDDNKAYDRLQSRAERAIDRLSA